MANPTISDREIVFHGDVDETLVKDTVKEILKFNVEDTKNENDFKEFVRPPIIIHLSTYGGEFYTGMSLFDVIRNSKTPVQIMCSGKIMSMGILLLLSAKKENRFAMKHTRFMIHEVASGVSGKLEHISQKVEQMKAIQETADGIILDNTTIPKNKLEDIMSKKQDWYFDSREALSYGLVSEIIGG